MLKRNIKITFRLNAKEQQQLKKNVKRTGLSQETYIRRLIEGYVPKELPPIDYHAMMRELNAIGNSMNQIAARANATGFLLANEYASYLLAVLKDQKKTKGRTRIQSFNGRPTKVFAIMAKDMKTFSKEAKEYGILYAAVMNRKSTDGIVDVVVSANDAARVNRIAERFALSTIEIQKTVNTPAEERAADTQNPTARTDNRNPSAHSSGSKERSETADTDSEHARPSVRQQLKDIRQERQSVHRKPLERSRPVHGELRICCA